MDRQDAVKDWGFPVGGDNQRTPGAWVEGPHCGYDEEYTVYLNVEEITCFVCEKTFRVQLYAANVELKPVGEV